MKSTIVTALYDINRDKLGDGRTIQEYLVWFDKTLQLNTNFVIYTESKFVDFIKQRRNYKNTIIIEQNLNKIPYYIYKDKIDQIINSNEYKLKIKDSSRIECNLSTYNIIQYSKFDWLKSASNIIDSDYYFWMDAGCSRFFEIYDNNISWPSNYSILTKNKLNIQGNINTIKYYQNWPGDDYIWDNNCILVGTLFGGTKIICEHFAKLVKDNFEFYLNNQCVNNEQILLGILSYKYPELFNIYLLTNNSHLPFFRALV